MYQKREDFSEKTGSICLYCAQKKVESDQWKLDDPFEFIITIHPFESSGDLSITKVLI